MLTSQRHTYILNRLQKEGSVSASQLVEDLNTSVSTIRRDLETLEKQNLLKRVHGGAIRMTEMVQKEDDVQERRKQNQNEKQKIGKAAAGLIEAGDFVYIDAGTSTEAMLEFIPEGKIAFVTNAITHAQTLAQKGYEVSLVGGQFKALTQAIVGVETLNSLKSYNFTKGFFGTNGIDDKGHLTTPDRAEAAVKKAAMDACEQKFILADPSKFTVKSRMNFGSVKDGTIITTDQAKPYVQEFDSVIFA